MKKGLLIMLILVLAQGMKIYADEQQSFSIPDAVKVLIENDISLSKAQLDEIELESGSRFYQEELFSDRNDQLADLQEEYNDKSAKWSSEMNAYRLLFPYMKSEKALEMEKENVNIANQELRVVNEKYKEGFASQNEVKQAEMSVANAEVSLKSSEHQLKQQQYQINQQFGQELDTEIQFEPLPELKRVEISADEREELIEELLETHDSLVIYQEIVSANEFFLKKSEGLEMIDEEGNEEELERLENKLEQLDQEISKEEDPDRRSELQGERTSLQSNIRSIKQSYYDARNDYQDAQKELPLYYTQEIKRAEMNLQEQKNKIELKAYEYLNTFNLYNLRLDTLEEQVKNQEKLYSQQKILFEEGDINPMELERARLDVLQKKDELLNLKNDYALLKEEFRLFKDGYLP